MFSKLIFHLEAGALYVKKPKVEAKPDSEQVVDMKKAKEEKENAKQLIQEDNSDFMSDCVIKKSLIERDQERAKRIKEKQAEQNIKRRGETKGIVMAFDIS